MVDENASGRAVQRFDESLSKQWRELNAGQPAISGRFDLECIEVVTRHEVLRILSEEIAATSPAQLEAFAAWQTREDMALWAMINAPGPFMEAMRWARQQQLRGGRWWSRYTMPSGDRPSFNPEQFAGFAAALSGYLSKRRARGMRVRVERRKPLSVDGDTLHLVANVADYPSFSPKERQFELEFRFNAPTGALDLCSDQPHHEQDVVELFARHFLGSDEPVSPMVLRLDRLCDAGSAPVLRKNDQVTAIHARWAQVRSLISGEPSVRWDFAPGTSVAVLAHQVATAESAAEITGFGLEWTVESPEREPFAFSVDLASPNRFTLPDKPAHIATLAEGDLRRWGVLP